VSTSSCTHRDSRSACFRVLCSPSKMLAIYDGHFFPHANVDIRRLRFFSRSLVHRLAEKISSLSQYKTDPSNIRAINASLRLGAYLVKNRCQDDSLDLEEYAARVVIHVCEYTMSKVEGLMYETTDVNDTAKRSFLKHGSRDVGKMEIAVMEVLDWNVYAGIDRAMPECDGIIESNAAKGEEDACVYFSVNDSAGYRIVEDSVVRVQIHQDVGKERFKTTLAANERLRNE